MEQNSNVCGTKKGRWKKSSNIFRNCRFLTMKEKCVSSMAENVESREILSFRSEWKIGADGLFVTCLNEYSEKKSEKLTKNYLDLFINTSLNYVSIRSCLVSKQEKINHFQMLNNNLTLQIYHFW